MSSIAILLVQCWNSRGLLLLVPVGVAACVTVKNLPRIPNNAVSRFTAARADTKDHTPTTNDAGDATTAAEGCKYGRTYNKTTLRKTMQRDFRYDISSRLQYARRGALRSRRTRFSLALFQIHFSDVIIVFLIYRFRGML
ncbi:hypothetical protein L596_010217 [Steinernema carpocapsae]|uniref:Uncharacterized protein n=1 Tax=Steinernema carpocapsae TaxID=34508 RepID=A0A4U5PI80_STECR|nr:hypothetical protein L596_010217 [Steinernema carpocapsae]